MNCPVCDNEKVIGIAGTDYPCPACVTPDLLAALEAALDSMTNQKPLGTREIVLKQIRAAIAEAEATR